MNGSSMNRWVQQSEREIRRPREVIIERRNSMPAPTADRRTQPRCKLALALTLHGGHNFYLGVSENISEGGIFIFTFMKLEIGEHVEVEFTLPTLDRPCRVTGEVRWFRSPDSNRAEHNNYGSVEDEAHSAGYGIQFHGLRPEDREAIQEFLRTRQPDFYE